MGLVAGIGMLGSVLGLTLSKNSDDKKGGFTITPTANEGDSVNVSSPSGLPGGPHNDNDEDKNKSKKIEISKDDAPHMLQDRPGHLPDTPDNRKLLIDLASNLKNFLGLDKYGTEWYAQIIDNGKQLWAVVRNGLIRNGGINEVPRPFNPETGLSRLLK